MYPIREEYDRLFLARNGALRKATLFRSFGQWFDNLECGLPGLPVVGAFLDFVLIRVAVPASTGAHSLFVVFGPREEFEGHLLPLGKGKSVPVLDFWSSCDCSF